MLLLCSVLNRQKKPLDGKSGGKEGRETTSAGGRRREWLLDFMFQLYVDGRGTVSNQHRLVNDDVDEISTNEPSKVLGLPGDDYGPVAVW